MVKPKDPYKISLQDLINSSQGDTVTSILIDLNGFWTYENREVLVASDNDNTGDVDDTWLWDTSMDTVCSCSIWCTKCQKLETFIIWINASSILLPSPLPPSIKCGTYTGIAELISETKKANVVQKIKIIFFFFNKYFLTFSLCTKPCSYLNTLF